MVRGWIKRDMEKDGIKFTTILSTGTQLLCVVHVQWVAVSVVHYTEGWDGLGQVSHKSITNTS